MRVLVIEDDGASRAILISTLRSRRHEIVACTDAESAWGAFGTDPPPMAFDLAIIDIGLPGQDGIAFCRQFRRHPVGRHAVVVLVTADDRIETLEVALEAGVHDYVVKPIDRRALGIRLAIAEQRSLANAASRYSREALRESESRFEAFMANSPTAAFIKDAHGRFLYVNRRYLELFQIEESDRIGRTQSEIFPREVADALQRSDNEVLERGLASETLEQVQLPDGLHDWLTYKFPLQDALGRSTLVAGLAIDITDRLRAERALKAGTEALLRQQARAETVLRVAGRLSALTDLRAVLDAICAEVRGALGTRAASVSLLDPATGALRLAASSGMSEGAQAVFTDVPREAWEAYRADFAPVLEIRDLRKTVPAERIALIDRVGLRTCLAALVRREDRVLGIVAAWTHGAERAFGADERALLQGVADQAALAITNVQLLDDLRQAEASARRERDRAEALLRLAHQVGSQRELGETLQTVCDQTRLALQTSAAAVFVYQPDERLLHLGAVSGGPPGAASGFVPSPIEPHLKLAPLDVPIVTISEFADATTLFPNYGLFSRLGVRSAALVRMIRDGELIGILAVGEVGARRDFSDDDVALLRGLGDQAAMAIRNAQLLDARLRTEQALRQSEERFRVALKNSPIVVSTQDRELRYSWAYSPDDPRLEGAVGRNDDDLLDTNQAERLNTLKRGVLETGIGERVETELRSRDGRTRYFDLTVEPLRDRSGAIVGITTAGVDITDRRTAELERARLEEQMRNAQKLESLGVLAGGIAHDFNNLLVGVLGNAGLALTELTEDSPVRHAIKDIETSAQRAAELTRQMLAYSGRGKFLVEPVNLSKIVQEMTQLLGRVISKQARFSLHLATDLPAIVADATQIRQVVMNLITNASDALDGRPGSVTIDTGVVDADRQMLASTYLNEELPSGRYVFLEVNDSGVGMDQATRARIFEPFFTTKFTGRGLGLAAVLGIVRGHKGAIDVRSEPGGGTTFRVLFPAAPQAVTAIGDAATTPARWKSSGVVLLVDDEEAVRTVARRVLERSGFGVLEAPTGEQALTVCAEHEGNLRAVLLDLTMPGLSGEATLGEIRRRWPTLPVIVSSGFIQEEGGGLGAVPFLAKPYKPADLVDVVRRLLET